jgi:hypothetical protein
MKNAYQLIGWCTVAICLTVAVNNQIFTLNGRIGEVGAAMGDRSKLQSNDYSIQRFK